MHLTMCICRGLWEWIHWKIFLQTCSCWMLMWSKYWASKSILLYICHDLKLLKMSYIKKRICCSQILIIIISFHNTWYLSVANCCAVIVNQCRLSSTHQDCYLGTSLVCHYFNQANDDTVTQSTTIICLAPLLFGTPKLMRKMWESIPSSQIWM